MAAANRVKGSNHMDIQHRKLVVPVLVGFECVSALDLKRKENTSPFIYFTLLITKRIKLLVSEVTGFQPGLCHLLWDLEHVFKLIKPQFL